MEETMKPNLTLLSLAVVLLFLFSACGPADATPVTNPPAVETSLASTALALAKQTEAANPFTATPSVTPTETPTPTPKISLSGTTLTAGEDPNTLFTDYKAGIQLVIPAGWMPFRVNEQEYYDAFTSEVVLANPPLNDRLIQVQSVDLETFRLDAFDIREGHIVGGVISDISVYFYADDMRTLEQWAEVEGKQKSPFRNYLYLNRGYPKLENGNRVLIIDRTWTLDQSNKVLRRSVFFSIPTGTLVLDFQTNNGFKDTVLPDFEQVVNSVTLLNP